MKKLLLVLAALFFALPAAQAIEVRQPRITVRPAAAASAEPSPSKEASSPSVCFTVGAVQFIMPDGFVCAENTADALSFESSEGAAIVVQWQVDMGLLLEEYPDQFQELFPFDNLISFDLYTDHAPCFVAEYTTKYLGIDVFGKYIGIVDPATLDLYGLNYYTTAPLTAFDESSIDRLVNSISLVSAEPTPEPTPTATPEPAFDFDAINRNPDKYEGQVFHITGKVIQVLEDEESENGTIVSTRVATKGDSGDIIFMMYVRQKGEDRILEGDVISFTGSSEGLFSYTAYNKQQITLPLFYGSDVTYVQNEAK